MGDHAVRTGREALGAEEVAALVAVLWVRGPGGGAQERVRPAAAWRRPEREPAFGGAHSWGAAARADGRR